MALTERAKAPADWKADSPRIAHDLPRLGTETHLGANTGENRPQLAVIRGDVLVGVK